MFLEIGGFNIQSQRTGYIKIGEDLGSEDILLQRKINKYPLGIKYLPSMQVKHKVPEERLTYYWFKKRAYSQGISNKFMDNLDKIESRQKVLEYLISRFILKLIGSKDNAIIRKIKLLNLSRLGYLKS